MTSFGGRPRATTAPVRSWLIALFTRACMAVAATAPAKAATPTSLSGRSEKLVLAGVSPEDPEAQPAELATASGLRSLC